MHRYIFEPPVTQVAIEKFALGVSGLGLQLFDLGIDVAVADQDVGPAVVVEIEKAASPAEIFGVEAEAGGEGGVLEAGAAEIVIERGCVAGEIGFYQVEVAVEIVVGGRDSHARLGLAVRAKGATGFERDVDKLAVLLVLVARAGGGVRGDVNVEPPVVVKIDGEHTE